jgi:hypothetical protein
MPADASFADPKPPSQLLVCALVVQLFAGLVAVPAWVWMDVPDDTSVGRRGFLAVLPLSGMILFCVTLVIWGLHSLPKARVQ